MAAPINWKATYLKPTFDKEKDNSDYWKEITKRCYKLHEKVFKLEFFVNWNRELNTQIINGQQTHLSVQYYLDFLSQSKIAYKDDSVVNDTIKKIELSESELNSNTNECIKNNLIIIENKSFFYNFTNSDAKLYNKFDNSDLYRLESMRLTQQMYYVMPKWQ